MKWMILATVLIATGLFIIFLHGMRRPASPVEAPTVSQPKPLIVSLEPTITMTADKADPPELRRKYRATVGDGFVIEVQRESSRFSGRRDRYSTLTQPDRRYVLFDSEKVADKIIDRELYPLVQPVVDRMLELDAAYMASPAAKEFTDTNGVRWRQVQ
jgi:hypothetical protein